MISAITVQAQDTDNSAHSLVGGGAAKQDTIFHAGNKIWDCGAPEGILSAADWRLFQKPFSTQSGHYVAVAVYDLLLRGILIVALTQQLFRVPEIRRTRTNATFYVMYLTLDNQPTKKKEAQEERSKHNFRISHNQQLCWYDHL